jgi:hypothetical protein
VGRGERDKDPKKVGKGREREKKIIVETGKITALPTVRLLLILFFKETGAF